MRGLKGGMVFQEAVSKVSNRIVPKFRCRAPSFPESWNDAWGSYRRFSGGWANRGPLKGSLVNTFFLGG